MAELSKSMFSALAVIDSNRTLFSQLRTYRLRLALQVARKRGIAANPAWMLGPFDQFESGDRQERNWNTQWHTADRSSGGQRRGHTGQTPERQALQDREEDRRRGEDECPHRRLIQ